MKKSEMIKLIANYLEFHYASMSEPALDNFKLTAEGLLDDIEYEGMLPPLNENNVHPQDTDDRKYENTVIKYFHQWEEERD